MDPSAFDDLSRTLVSGGTRRRLLGRLGTLLPAVGLGIVLGEDAEARGRSHGRNRGHRPGKSKDNRKGLRNGPKDAPGGDHCRGACNANEACCNNGGPAHCCPTDSSVCCGWSNHCCPIDGYVCCGIGGQATCCPTVNRVCWPDPNSDDAECILQQP